MAERKNLPAATAAQDVAVSTAQRGSLVGRGLIAVQSGTILSLTKNNVALYRQARTEFDRWYLRGYQRQASLFGWEMCRPLLDWDRDHALFSAFKIFQELANKGFGKAYYPLSTLIEDQNRAQHFTRMAFEWSFASQDNQDVELWSDLGNMYQEGRGVEQNDEQATYWFRKAAEGGDAIGQWELGLNYREGRGVVVDDEQGFYWMCKAAEQGNSAMQGMLGELFELDSKYEQAAYWYRKAAEQGLAWAQSALAYMYQEGRVFEQDYEQAVYWYRKAAEQHNATAQWKLGEMYANGHGVAQDNGQAEYWFCKAAEQDGWGEDQNNLGEMYVLGRGVEQDWEQAVYWFRKSAEQDDADAQFNLGEMYRHGYGVAEDDEQAVYWYRRAAEQGRNFAQYNLAKMYQEGRGVGQDDEQAIHWYRELNEQDGKVFDENDGKLFDEMDGWHEVGLQYFEELYCADYGEWMFNYGHWAQRFSRPTFFPDEKLTTVPQDMLVLLSHTGHISALPLDDHPARHYDSEDIYRMFVASTHDYILCFSNRGQVYRLRGHDVPQGSSISSGKPIDNLLQLDEKEKVVAILPVGEFDDNHFIFMATSSGIVKKTPLSDFPCYFSRQKKRGIIAINLDEDDFLIGVAITDGQRDIMLFSDDGKAVRFEEGDVRVTGRNSRGVIGMRLREGHKVISLLVAENENQSVLTATENGYGKRTPITEYTRHGRGTLSMMAIQTSERNGKVVAATLVEEKDEIMLIT
ncbi:MAG: DNA gyrase C-terminal beta-propeller domain-containing protein, partial [Sulfurimicrobium sp.]|nr:DNA gyrase C-terminal beta-propeller domain-containing protein [Sulfurimicrobium sp.]